LRITASTALVLIGALTFSLNGNPAFGSSSHKCKKPACDISAIGHRKFYNSGSVGNWYSLEKEKEFGEKYAAAVEQRVDLVEDADLNGYVDRIAQRIVQNSDADMPITVRIIRRNDAGAFTLAGGHLYLTTGLLLKLQSEGEFASVLARGVAHAALHSVMRLQTRAALLQIASIPALDPKGLPHAPAQDDMWLTFGLLKFQRTFELQADYFGIQYVYKSGYDTSCFLSAVQTLWQPDSGKPQVKAFDAFPPLEDRLKVLHQEIDDILPMLPEAIVSAPQFDLFIGRLRQIAPPETAPTEDPGPKLIRHDLAANN
jgi:predicted Zn-dependent protease